MKLKSKLERMVVFLAACVLGLIIAGLLATSLQVQLGDVGQVWSAQAFVFAALFGFGFGYLVVAQVSAQARWSTANEPLAYGWIVGLLGSYFIAGLVVSQVLAAFWTGDVQVGRIISRLGPYLVGTIAAGVGVYIALELRRESKK